MYGKVFGSMYDGTLYGHWEAIVTFQQMIVLADADGIVDMTPQALAARTSLPIDIIIKGIKHLEEPDPYTRTPGEEGRRIETIDEHRPWGWHIVNYEKYKMIVDADTVRGQNRERKRRERDRKAESRSVTLGHAGHARSRHIDIDIDIDKKPPSSTSVDAFGVFWKAYPKKVGKAAALRSWKRSKPDLQAVLDALKPQVASKQWTKDGGQFIPNPATWINQGRWDDEVAIDGAAAKMTCTTCKQPITGGYTGSECDPCWKRGQGMPSTRRGK